MTLGTELQVVADSNVPLRPGDLVRVPGYGPGDVLGVIGEHWPFSDRYRVAFEQPVGLNRMAGGWFEASELVLVTPAFARLSPEAPPAQGRRDDKGRKRRQ
jgi:hypothetical protein